MTRSDSPSHYPLEAAIADVVDACIRSGAREIDVVMEFAGSQSWISISADGRGLDLSELSHAQFTSDLAYTASLQGLDLVSACLLAGRTVTVAVRCDPTGFEVVRWSAPDAREPAPRRDDVTTDAAPPQIVEPLRAGARSVVLVEELQAILGHRWPDGLRAQGTLLAARDVVSGHLGLVFHRHLAGGVRRPGAVAVRVNGQPVEPLDPMREADGWEAVHRRRSLPFLHGDRVYEVVVIPYVAVSRVTAVDADVDPPNAAAARSRLRTGLYVYCANRLIQLGTWSRLRIPHHEGVAVRIAVDVPLSADAAFTRNLRLLQVLFPPSLIPGLKAVALAAVNEALVAAARRLAVPRPGDLSPVH